MALDFINTYFPDVSTVDAAKLQNVRARLDTYIKAKYPDLDTRPNSVFGDLGLSPFAYLVAGVEQAVDGLISDLDLEKVAAGVITNCDMVRAYLGNFAGVAQTTLKSSGVIRLVFCADAAYTVERRARYLFGTGNEFTLRLPHPGNLYILPVGQVPDPFTNEYALKQIAEEEYAIDIGVVGTMTTQVSAGDSGTTDYVVDLDDLTRIAAVTNFDFGLPSESLATLAQKTRESFYTATMTTRSGTKNYMSREFADLTAVSPIVPGDTEAVRASVNPLGVANGKMDVCVHSKNFGTSISQTFKLDYDTNAFYGALDLVEVPYIFESIVYAGDTDIDLGVKGPTGDITILSQSSDFSKAPLLTSAYSTYENLWIKINMPTDGATDLITPVSSTGNPDYALFTVTYKADPMVKVVSDVLSAADVTPVGVDVLVKGFTPVVINNLIVSYTKKPGVTMALDTARTEIYDYFKSLGYNKIYAASKIYDAMYYAGAEDVVSIAVDSDVQWSIADRILPVGVTAAPITSATYTDAYAAGLTMPASVADTLGATAAFHTTTYGILDKRNRGYYLAADNIKFSEVVL